jgi:hypothetical protein
MRILLFFFLMIASISVKAQFSIDAITSKTTDVYTEKDSILEGRILYVPVNDKKPKLEYGRVSLLVNKGRVLSVAFYDKKGNVSEEKYVLIAIVGRPKSKN